MGSSPSRGEAERALKEALRRAKQRAKVDFQKLCFGPQLDFVRDDNHLVVAVCSRRAGKTEGIAFKLLDTASRIPHSQCLYITLSRPTAKRNLWPKLLRWNRLLDLGAKFNHAELSMTLPNGSSILLGGANDAGEIERYRGLDQGTPLAILDEAQAFRPYIKSLVEDILDPATIDMKGTIVMIGTPNPMSAGYFYEACKGIEPGWSPHHWTILENPFIPHAREWLEENVVKRRRLPKTDPRYQREWLGIWVKDSSGLVHPVPEFALIDEMPEAPDWSYVLGVDVGYVDATAFVTMAYSPLLNQVVTVESHQKSEMIPTAVAIECERLWQMYDYERIVVDPGGGGKAYVEELKQRYSLPAEVAQKSAKAAARDVLNGDLRSGVLKVIQHDNLDLLHDASLLQYDYTRLDKLGGSHASAALKSKELLRVDDRTPDHLTDAWLYGHRFCRAYLYEEEHEPPKAGTPAAIKAEEDGLLAKALKRAQEAQRPAEELWGWSD